MINKRIYMDFMVGSTAEKNKRPEEFFLATVPGAVQLDMARAKGWADYRYADNYKKYLYMEDLYWLYTAKIPELNGGRVFFVSKGIDYHFEISLNGILLLEQEGMFTPVELELTKIAKVGDTLEILIYPVPKSVAEPVFRVQADHCVKPACSYGWDWHPRLIPSGIWDETYLEIRKENFLDNPFVLYELNDDFSRAELILYNAENALWKLYDPENKLVFEKTAECNAVVENPDLWWCTGQGEPKLYTSVVELVENGVVIGTKIQKIGFRRSKLVMHEGGWDAPNGMRFPTECNSPPMTIELNGRVLFAKGSNWVPPEIFYGLITKETYAPLLELAKDANMNILRCWGGQIINKECFYELCDELGLMVWQEFPLSCNFYFDDVDYLKVLDQESRSVIERLRLHPCIVMWSGGNELFNAWSRCTEQSHPLRLLNRNCFDLDRNTPYINTSPLMNVGHGDYTFRNAYGEDVFEVFPKNNFIAYCEFGVPGPSAPEYIAQFIPKEQCNYPVRDTAWETHHAFNSVAPQHGWMHLHNIEYYFGKLNSYDEIYERGTWLQSEGYKAIFEEARRQKPVCSMALNWCYNEPWPTAANNSIINYPSIPRPSFYTVKASLRPILASAAIKKFDWKGGECFETVLWLLNDSYDTIKSGNVNISIEIAGKVIALGQWTYPATVPNKNMKGIEISFILPHEDCEHIKLILEAGEYSSEYKLLYHE